jgi:NTP pyrophosphatase (non-canonical NTP hydrolase)
MTLSPYYLVKIAEEAAEVAQIALKAAHFGLSETQPGRDETNAQRVYAELNDLLSVVNELANVAGGEFDFQPDDFAMVKKAEKVAGYLRYSQSLGLVEADEK